MNYITAVHKAQPGWRRVIAQAVLWGIPTPAFSTALAFFDGYRSEVVPANLLQAQVLLKSSYYTYRSADCALTTYSAITSVRTLSQFCQARRMKDSRPARRSVSA